MTKTQVLLTYILLSGLLAASNVNRLNGVASTLSTPNAANSSDALPSITSSQTMDILRDSDTGKIIILIHGVFGDPMMTWTNGAGVSWPGMMKQDPAFHEFAIGTMRYETPYLDRTSGIEEVATRLLRRLKDEGIFRKYKEIYFIGHSLGGLLVKRMLVDLNRPSQVENLRRVKAVLYISTPAQGANVAEVASWLSLNPQLRDMRPADLNSFLQSLENQWQNLVREDRKRFPLSFCAYETKRSKGILVVSRVYAQTICDDNPLPVDEDHSGIVKPRGLGDDIYVWTRARILDTTILAAKVAANKHR